MVHFTLFHLKSPKKIIFLTYMFSLWCWPEFKASRRSACSHFVSSWDSWWCSGHTNLSRIYRVLVWGNKKKAAKAVWKLCLVCLFGQVGTWSVLMLQWVGHEEIQKLLICAGSISSKDTGICCREGCRICCPAYINCPFNKDSEFAVALDIRQGVVPLQWYL